jgi:TPR repeat protein
MAIAALFVPSASVAQEPEAARPSETADRRAADEQPAAPAYDTQKLADEAHDLKPDDLPRLRARADGGDARAQVLLGLAHEIGVAGLEPQPGEALAWFLKAAAQGVSWAEAWAADFYYHGSTGIDRDLSRALALYTSAANHGDIRAAFVIGQMHFYGEGVPLNHREAAVWFRRATPSDPDIGARMAELAEAACDSSFCTSLRQVMGAIMTGTGDRIVDGWNATSREWDAAIRLPDSERCGLTTSDKTDLGDVQNYFCDSARIDDEARGTAMAKQLADAVEKALPPGYSRNERDMPRPGPSIFFARDGGYPHLRVTFNITPGSAQHRVTLLVGP